MEFAAGFDQLAQLLRAIPPAWLLGVAVLALMLAVAGSMLAGRTPAAGRTMRRVSTALFAAAGLLVVLQNAHVDPRLSMATGEPAFPDETVAGGETRIPVAADGHYWVEAQINGQRAAFMVDTGATLVSVSQSTADAAGLLPSQGGMPIVLGTANGQISAYTTSIASFSFGNIAAQGLEAVIVPGEGDTNVIGMNLLSRLAVVRIEQGVLVLVPNAPRPAVPATD